MGRRLGQHFLTQPGLLHRIAEAAVPAPGSHVVEIGPGRGSLTAHLLSLAARVTAIEIDPVLAQYLRNKFRGDPRLEVVEGDILKVPLTGRGQVTVAGNLPYYIASPIVRKVLALEAALDRAVFLVQKEVAQRLAASPGARDYGFLSVTAQLLAEVDLLFSVPRGAFRPPPKVDSAVVRFTPLPADRLLLAPGFLDFAAACFRHKRKTIRNNLLGAFPPETLAAEPETARRAEQLSVPLLAALHKRLLDARTDRGANALLLS